MNGHLHKPLEKGAVRFPLNGTQGGSEHCDFGCPGTTEGKEKGTSGPLGKKGVVQKDLNGGPRDDRLFKRILVSSPWK